MAGSESKDIWRGMFYGFIAVALFSLTAPFTKLALGGFSAYFITVGRVAIAGIVASGMMLARKQPFPRSRYWFQIILVSLGTSVGFPMCLAMALTHTDASHAGIALTMLPIFTSSIGAWVNREKHGIKFWLMAISSFLTVFFYVIWKNGISFSIADSWLLAASISGAISYAVGGKLAKRIGGMNTICWAAIFSLPFSTSIGLYMLLYTEPFSTVSVTSLASFLYLALISQLLGFIPWYEGLKMGGIARVSQVQLLQTFLTLFAAWIFIGESVPWHSWLVAMVVVFQIYLTKKMA